MKNLRKFFAAAFAVGAIACAQAQPGPGPVPSPWTVNGNTIYYTRGPVLVGANSQTGTAGFYDFHPGVGYNSAVTVSSFGVGQSASVGFYNQQGVTDSKVWGLQAGSNAMVLNTYSDSNIAGSTAMTISRSGTSIAEIDFFTSTIFGIREHTAANYILQVDASALNAATGIKVAGAAAAGGAFISVLSTGSNEGLFVDAKGTGPITLGSVSTGGIIAGAATGGSEGAGTINAQGLYINGVAVTGAGITALTGDVTATGPGSAAATLATVNGNVGSFGSSTAIPTFTVNGKGLITAASTAAVVAPAGTLTGTTLASNVVTASLMTINGSTVPTASDTFALLAASQALTNKTYNGMTLTANSGTFHVGNAKSVDIQNTLTMTGTDGSTVAFGTGGTVLYSGGSGFVSSITGTAFQVAASGATGAVTLSIPSVARVTTSLAVGGCTIVSDTLCAGGTETLGTVTASQVIVQNNGLGSAGSFVSHASGTNAQSGYFWVNDTGTGDVGRWGITNSTAIGGLLSFSTYDSSNVVGQAWLVGDRAAASTAIEDTYFKTPTFEIYPDGSSNPVFKVDASASSVATGWGVTGAAAASGAALSVLSTGTNENGTIDAKGSGTLTLNPNATGNVLVSRALVGSSTVQGTQLISTISTGTAPLSVASTTNVANLNASSLNGATFAAPGAIGSGTPGSGAFTTGSFTGAVTSAVDMTFANNHGVNGRTSGGTAVGIGYMDASNILRLGDSGNSGANITSGGSIVIQPSASTTWTFTSSGPTITTIPADTATTDASLCRATSGGAMLTGTGTLGICLGTSTKEAKIETKAIHYGLKEVLALRPLSYRYKAGWGFPTDKDYYGFFAEEVNKVMPLIAPKDAKGNIPNYDYIGLETSLITSIQQEHSQVVMLQKQVRDFKAENARLRTAQARTDAKIDGLMTVVAKLRPANENRLVRAASR